MAKQFTPQEVLDTMRKISIMTLAVSGSDNQPQSHVMLFTIDPDFTIYFTTSKDSSKHNALKENPKVGLSVWSENEMLVQIQGSIEELETNDELDALDKLAEAAVSKPNFWSPLLQIMKKDYAVFKITPNSIRALDLTIDSMTSATTMFTNIGTQL